MFSTGYFVICQGCVLQNDWVSQKVNASSEHTVRLPGFTLVMKHPNTSPSRVSMARKVFLDKRTFDERALIVDPSLTRLYFNQKLSSEQDIGR